MRGATTIMRTRVALLVLLICVAGPRGKATQVTISAPPQPVPPSFFGLHIHHLNSPTPWPPIAFASWRLWDAHVTWADLEPQPGKWHFEKLDEYIAEASAHQIDVVVPLAMSPRWASARPNEAGPYGPGGAAEPAHLDDWRNYVRTVATRYKGRVKYYELWNEANGGFFTGTLNEMLELSQDAYSIIKEVDPRALVVSPSATAAQKGVRWLDRYLANGGGKFADIIGFHFYVSPRPELLVDLIRDVRRVMQEHGVADKPLWNTESGWLIQNSDHDVLPNPSYGPLLSQEEAAAYVGRSFVLGWASGVQRFYWYAWDNGNLGLTEPGGKVLKAPARAYGEVESWLLGAVMKSCASDDSDTWTCELSRGSNYRAWIVWNPRSARQFTPPATWQATRVRELSGAVHDLSGGYRGNIGPAPALFERGNH